MNIISKFVILFIFVVSCIILGITYFKFMNNNLSNIYNVQNKTTENYGKNILDIINYSSTHINYAVQFMKEFSIYNQTLDNYIKLSSINDTISSQYINALSIYYNISFNDRLNYENQMSQQLGKNITFQEIGLDKQIILANNKSWYCPGVFQSPIDSNTNYIPGLDITNVSTFAFIKDQLINNDEYSLFIEPRKGVLKNITVLDFALKTSNGILVLSLLIDKIIQIVLGNNSNVELYYKGLLFYKNINIYNNDSSYITNILLSNNKTIDMIVSYSKQNTDISSFLYVLLTIIFIDIIIVAIIINYKIGKNRYLIADKMLGYVNHEIRNLLNCINGLINLIIEEIENGEINNNTILSNLYITKKCM